MSAPQPAALVPFWAVWPFELLVLPRRPIGGFEELTLEEEIGLAKLLQAVVATYDRLFGVPFPYSMLRSANIRKFQVGFEILGMPQRDFTPEEAAQKLRAAAKAGTP